MIRRKSRPEMNCYRDILKNLTKLIGKHPCRSLLLNKVAGLKRNFQEYSFFIDSVEYVRCFFRSLLEKKILTINLSVHSAQKMKFSVKDFCNKCGQTLRFLRI